MNPSPRLYLDNAATSWPKPEAVYLAVENYLRNVGVAAGRGNYADAADIDRDVEICRRALADFLHVPDSKQIVWTCNGTDSLNLALQGLLRPGDHVVTTVAEHNSVLRPLHFLSESRQVSSTFVPTDEYGFVSPDDIRQAIQPTTRLIAVIHASNVTGALQPIEEIGQIAQERGIRLMVDAAQTAGHIPIDVQAAGIDLLAAPTHKGLYSPLGLGFLYIGNGLEAELTPLRLGGTGTHSEQDRQPSTMPDRYESGNLNVPAIIGLAAGLKAIGEMGIEAIQSRHHAWTEEMLAGLHAIPDLEIFGPPTASNRVPLISIRHPALDPRELAAALDAAFHIQTRAGIHCAPQMHRQLGTLPTGTLRLSAGWNSSPEEVPFVLSALSDICVG